MDNVEGARKKAEKGDLCFGTIDSWLLFKLTNGKAHTTDVTNASRTMLFNIHSLTWDEELLKLFNIPVQCPAGSKIKQRDLWRNRRDFNSYPRAGLWNCRRSAGSAFRPNVHQARHGKKYLWYGLFYAYEHWGPSPVLSKNNLLTTIAWKIGDTTTYALEGGVFIGGAVVQWLRDGLGIIKNSAEVEKLATSVKDNGGVYFVPAFAGLGAPYWNQFARGTMLGITRGTTAAHIARASIESIALQTMDVLHAMNADAGLPIKELRVDGGATANDLLMQFQSDVLDCKVIRPQNNRNYRLRRRLSCRPCHRFLERYSGD